MIDDSQIRFAEVTDMSGANGASTAMLLPHIDWVKDTLAISSIEDGSDLVEVSRSGLVELLQRLISVSAFDEHYYLEDNPDVAAAVEAGRFRSGFHHYLCFGYLEGRFPGFMEFDSEAYIEANPDLTSFRSSYEMEKLAREHFIQFGFKEGRPTQPSP